MLINLSIVANIAAYNYQFNKSILMNKSLIKFILLYIFLVYFQILRETVIEEQFFLIHHLGHKKLNNDKRKNERILC